MTSDEIQSGGDRSGTSTSRSLLADARSAVPGSWERLVRLYAPLVAAWCRRWSVPEQDLVDILQEVFLSVSGQLDRFRKERPADTFRGWLFTIARNKVRDRLRRISIEPAAAGGSEATFRMTQILDPHGEGVWDEATDDAVMDQLLKSALDLIRNEFHERTWQAFWGVVVDGRAAADVAADLDMKPGAVRVAKSRVLLRLRRELGDLPDSPRTDPS